MHFVSNFVVSEKIGSESFTVETCIFDRISMLRYMLERSTKIDVQQKGILKDNNGTTNRLFNWSGSRGGEIGCS